jgi:hypothetical protein
MNGEKIDDRDIRKHKNDVVRLFQLLSPENRMRLPSPIQNDFQTFLVNIKDDSSIDCKNLGLKHINIDQIVEILKKIYLLSNP